MYLKPANLKSGIKSYWTGISLDWFKVTEGIKLNPKKHVSKSKSSATVLKIKLCFNMLKIWKVAILDIKQIYFNSFFWTFSILSSFLSYVISDSKFIFLAKCPIFYPLKPKDIVKIFVCLNIYYQYFLWCTAHKYLNKHKSIFNCVRF